MKLQNLKEKVLSDTKTNNLAVKRLVEKVKSDRPVLFGYSRMHSRHNRS